MSQLPPARGRRKFVGLPPRFREGEVGLKRSPYYWWWEFLRRNDAYIKCCNADGAGPLADLYRDFGDVRSDDFKKWWRTIGEHIFSEPPVPVSIQVVPDAAAAAQLDLRGCILAVVPLTLDKRTLKRRFNELLRKNHSGKRGGNRFAKSLAHHPLASKPVVRALELTLRVYDLNVQNSEWKLWQIGQEAKVSKEYKVDPSVPTWRTRADRKMLAIYTSRFLKHAKAYIKNAGKGVFPKK